ncbi:hypothetical protein IMZ48_17120 [Candidatus Bathyarchaeota archaeon]|nr:hypothetical protein [Candidatus Bathyarchaeota archaeon]
MPRSAFTPGLDHKLAKVTAKSVVDIFHASKLFCDNHPQHGLMDNGGFIDALDPSNPRPAAIGISPTFRYK